MRLTSKCSGEEATTDERIDAEPERRSCHYCANKHWVGRDQIADGAISLCILVFNLVLVLGDLVCSFARRPDRSIARWPGCSMSASAKN